MNGSSDLGIPQRDGSLALLQPRARLQARGRLSRWCLATILAVGFVIVVADGLTRPLVLEEDWIVMEAMTYEPNHAAFVFALVMLPLMLAYQAATRISKKEAALLWFVMCTVAYAKDFSYMGVPCLPIFITDIVLLGLVLALSGSLRKGMRALGWAPRLALVWLFTSGAICAGRGFLSGQDPILVLRDFAIVVYATFLLVSFLIVSSWDRVKRIFLFFTFGALFSTVNGLAWLLMQPGQRRYISYGPYVLAAWLGTSALATGRLIRPALGWLLSSALAVGVLLANARTVYVSLALIVAIMVLVGPSARLRISRRTLRLGVGMIAAAFVLLWLVMQSAAGMQLVNTTMIQLESGTLNYADDPDAEFRFLAWLEAGQRFLEHPVIGEGFGVPFLFERTSYDVRPHNTFLTVLYKMGLLGFLPLAVLLTGFHWKGWRVLRSSRGHPGAMLLYVVLLAQLAASLFGFLNLMLESPFLASIFWLMLGVGLRIIDLLGRSPRIAAAALPVSAAPST